MTDPTNTSESEPTTNAGEQFELPVEGVRLDDVVKTLVRQALVRTNGNQSQAARLLGITRYALRYKMEKYGFVQSAQSRRRALRVPRTRVPHTPRTRVTEVHDGERSQ